MRLTSGSDFLPRQTKQFHLKNLGMQNVIQLQKDEKASFSLKAVCFLILNCEAELLHIGKTIV